MKRWPILVSFVLFIGLFASATFWAMQLFKPVARQVVAPKQQTKTTVNVDAAVGLFGGRAVAAAAASNFQLKGVVVASNPQESVAILAADGKPAEAIRVNAEVTPGVTVKEVHAQYVLLSEDGVIKRVELPLDAPQSAMASPIGAVTPVAAPGVKPAAPGAPPPPGEPPPNSPAAHNGRPH